MLDLRPVGLVMSSGFNYVPVCDKCGECERRQTHGVRDRHCALVRALICLAVPYLP